MITTNKKRRAYLGSVLSMLERVASLTETVLDEERDCLDNIPENLQTSERYEAERAGFPVDFIAVASDFMDGKDYKLDSGRNLIGAKRREIANRYKKDYERWKEAFGV